MARPKLHFHSLQDKRAGNWPRAICTHALIIHAMDQEDTNMITLYIFLIFFSHLYFPPQGIVAFRGNIYITFLVMRKRAPVFASAFAPLGTSMVAVMDLFILQQSLHMGR